MKIKVVDKVVTGDSQLCIILKNDETYYPIKNPVLIKAIRKRMKPIIPRWKKEQAWALRNAFCDDTEEALKINNFDDWHESLKERWLRVVDASREGLD